MASLRRARELFDQVRQYWKYPTEAEADEFVSAIIPVVAEGNAADRRDELAHFIRVALERVIHPDDALASGEFIFVFGKVAKGSLTVLLSSMSASELGCRN